MYLQQFSIKNTVGNDLLQYNNVLVLLDSASYLGDLNLDLAIFGQEVMTFARCLVLSFLGVIL